MKKIFSTMTALDKLTHFGWGAMICAFFTIVTLLQDLDSAPGWDKLAYCLVGTIATLIFALAKEMIDEKGDLLDFVASVLGCIPIWIAVILGIALNYK